ncbi:MAG: Uncharacterized inner membrane protein RarD, partial [uncultured Sphingomonas sp.]
GCRRPDDPREDPVRAGVRAGRLRPVGAAPDLLQAAVAGAVGGDRRAPDRLVAARAGAAGGGIAGLGRGAAGAAPPRDAAAAGRDLRADRDQLAGLCPRGQQRAHPGGEPRLLSQPAGQHPARLFRAEGAARAVAVAGGRDRRRRDRGAGGGSVGAPVDQPGAVLQLLSLRAAAQGREGGLDRRADDRNRVAVSAGLVVAAVGGWDRGAGMGQQRPGAVAAGRHRSRLDDSAAVLHRGGAAAALLDAGHSPVHRANTAVRGRGVPVRRSVHGRPRGRLRCNLDGRGAIPHLVLAERAGAGARV